jgi:hypothetical protein
MVSDRVRTIEIHSDSPSHRRKRGGFLITPDRLKKGPMRARFCRLEGRPRMESCAPELLPVLRVKEQACLRRTVEKPVRDS